MCSTTSITHLVCFMLPRARDSSLHSRRLVFSLQRAALASLPAAAFPAHILWPSATPPSSPRMAWSSVSADSAPFPLWGYALGVLLLWLISATVHALIAYHYRQKDRADRWERFQAHIKRTKNQQDGTTTATTSVSDMPAYQRRSRRQPIVVEAEPSRAASASPDRAPRTEQQSGFVVF